MKTAMNLLLWTAAADRSHFPLLKNIKNWGFDGVELPMFSHDGSPWKELDKTLDDLELGRTVVACLPAGTSIISDDAGERQAAIDFLLGCVDNCAVVKADTLAGPFYSPVGKLVGRGPNDDERQRAAEGFRTVGEHAQKAGIALSIEPLNRFETYFINTCADSAKLVDAIGLDNVGFLFDTFHSNIEEKKVDTAIRHAARQINHVHISANDRATPGEDHVRWEEVFSALKSIEYDKWLTIEAFGAWLPELAGATCIWRTMAPSEEHVARHGLDFIKRSW
nr:D-tagatose 3-epimerase [uncultured bacterium]